MDQLLQDAGEVGAVAVAEPRPARRNRAWSLCAAVALLWLALSPAIQDAFHRSFSVAEPTGYPNDFPVYFLASQIAARPAPDNLLYYPPARGSWSVFELTVDAASPYAKFVAALRASGAPARHAIPFITPPFSALLLAPLARLPWQKAYLIWQFACLLMMVASLYLALRLADDRVTPLGLAISPAVVLLFRPFRAMLALGNIDVAILFLWVLGAFASRRRYPTSSALCFALGTAIKFSPIFAVPLLVLRKQWRWVYGYVLISGILLVLSIGILGWHNHVVWATQVSPSISRGLRDFNNRSLPGLILALTGLHRPAPAAPMWGLLIRTLSAVGYLGFLFWWWRQRKDSQALTLELILLPLVVLLLSPLTWTNHYVLAVPALLYMWVKSGTQPSLVSNLNLVLLTASTMFIGSVLPDSLVLALRLPVELLLDAGWVAATGALLWVGMNMHKRSNEFAFAEGEGSTCL